MRSSVCGERTSLGKKWIETIIKKLGERAGVSKAHPHRYRRTLATNLLDRGMNIQYVAAILGHADLRGGLDHICGYGHGHAVCSNI